jgi:hypothetical protein
VVETQLESKIKEAIDAAKQEGPSREISLTITKLEEALFWATADHVRNTPSVIE